MDRRGFLGSLGAALGLFTVARAALEEPPVKVEEETDPTSPEAPKDLGSFVYNGPWPAEPSPEALSEMQRRVGGLRRDWIRQTDAMIHGKGLT